MITETERDEHDGKGGTYEVDKQTGERRLVEASTKPHIDGGARTEDGELVDQPENTTSPALPAPAKAPWADTTTVNKDA